MALTADTAGDCDRETDAVDALHVLRNVASIGIPASCLAAGNVNVGRAYKLVAGLSDTQYTAALSGANQHRWRVWATGAAGHPGGFSEWRTFKPTYTASASAPGR